MLIGVSPLMSGEPTVRSSLASRHVPAPVHVPAPGASQVPPPRHCPAEVQGVPGFEPPIQPRHCPLLAHEAPLTWLPTHTLHSMLVVQATSGAIKRGIHTPLRGTRTAKAAFCTRAQLPTTGQVPVLLPVQHASGAPAAVHTLLGLQPLQSEAPPLAAQVKPL